MLETALKMMTARKTVMMALSPRRPRLDKGLRMMKKGWIREIMSDEPGLERRRLYQLTDVGREALRAEIARLRRMLENAEEV